MRVLLTSAGLETNKLRAYFINMIGKDMTSVKALFIPVAAIDADAVKVLPKCMDDLLICGILDENIRVYDLHTGMDPHELRQYDVVYLCGGNTAYLLERVRATGFDAALAAYIREEGAVLGVSAGSLIFSDPSLDSLRLINTTLEVHCTEGMETGRISYPFREPVRLTNTRALAIRSLPDMVEIVG